jgi:hypothetical protein
MAKTAKNNRPNSDGPDWMALVRDEPIMAVAIAGITGFFAGGGATTAPGRLATSIVARVVAREVAAVVVGALLANKFVGTDDSRAGKTPA